MNYIDLPILSIPLVVLCSYFVVLYRDTTDSNNLEDIQTNKCPYCGTIHDKVNCPNCGANK